MTAAAAKSLQSGLTLCDPIDGSPPGSAAPGILQARTLEWVAISFSNAWKWKVKVKSLSHVWLFGTPWTTAYQAPPSMGFSRQEYWSGVPLQSTGRMTTQCQLLKYHIWLFHFSSRCSFYLLTQSWYFVSAEKIHDRLSAHKDAKSIFCKNKSSEDQSSFLQGILAN